MNKEILNKIRDDAGFGYGVAVGLYTHDVTEMWVENDKDGEECWPSRELMEKFAELIVRECIRLCDQIDVVGADECIDNIKQHFEVKE